MLQRDDKDSHSHQILIPAPADGGPRGALPRAKTSTDRREPLEVSMQRIGERLLPIAAFAEEHSGHTLD